MSLLAAYFQVSMRMRTIGVALGCSSIAVAVWYGWILSPLYHDMCVQVHQNALLEKRIKIMRKARTGKAGQESSLISSSSGPHSSSTLSDGVSGWMNFLQKHTITLISCKQVGTDLCDQLRVYHFAVELYGTFTDLVRFLTQAPVGCQECTMHKQQSGVLLVWLFATCVKEKIS